MNQVAVINVVGLSKRLIGERTPFLQRWSSDKNISTIQPVLPAVTCSVQTTYLTGKWPMQHGIVANGWYFKDEQEIKLWRQSNKLVQAPSIWNTAKKRDSKFTCANMFWWYNMYSNVDYSVTPRPQYRANGLKVPDCYTFPANLRDVLQGSLGVFPLFDFWGPKTSIKSSQWIAEASKFVYDRYSPELILIYLPHLDYVLQKYGHDNEHLSKDLNEIDSVCEDLISYLESKGCTVKIISEYGITDVHRPIHINRILRKAGMICIREENGQELLDVGASKAVAMADHQVAHVYVNDQGAKEEVKNILKNTDGIELLIDDSTKDGYHINHERSGDFVIVADQESWFTYYYWEDDAKAPDFAQTVDIHKKPGYDPLEMFLDPKKKFILPRVALKLLKKKLGFRVLMDLIPLDAELVKGSHGRIHLDNHDKAIFIGSEQFEGDIEATRIHDLILDNVFNLK
jgi:predicted AlkP superfamily pyrophosphatase or phosphodiesterase